VQRERRRGGEHMKRMILWQLMKSKNEGLGFDIIRSIRVTVQCL